MGLEAGLDDELRPEWLSLAYILGGGAGWIVSRLGSLVLIAIADEFRVALAAGAPDDAGKEPAM